MKSLSLNINNSSCLSLSTYFPVYFPVEILLQQQKTEQASNRLKITPYKIQPLPTAEEICARRGHPARKAEMITLFRNQLIVKLKKKKPPAKPRSSFMEISSEPGDAEQGGKGGCQTMGHRNVTGNDPACCYCFELYPVRRFSGPNAINEKNGDIGHVLLCYAENFYVPKSVVIASDNIFNLNFV